MLIFFANETLIISIKLTHIFILKTFINHLSKGTHSASGFWWCNFWTEQLTVAYLAKKKKKNLL